MTVEGSSFEKGEKPLKGYEASPISSKGGITGAVVQNGEDYIRIIDPSPAGLASTLEALGALGVSYRPSNFREGL